MCVDRPRVAPPVDWTSHHPPTFEFNSTNRARSSRTRPSYLWSPVNAPPPRTSPNKFKVHLPTDVSCKSKVHLSNSSLSSNWNSPHHRSNSRSIRSVVRQYFFLTALLVNISAHTKQIKQCYSTIKLLKQTKQKQPSTPRSPAVLYGRWRPCLRILIGQAWQTIRDLVIDSPFIYHFDWKFL